VSPADARECGIAPGDPVRVSSNGTSRTLTARVNRRLRAGVVRIENEHAEGLEARVEVARA
jgi:anaerobic selenocysteine-containing dehydrogenase